MDRKTKQSNTGSSKSRWTNAFIGILAVAGGLYGAQPIIGSVTGFYNSDTWVTTPAEVTEIDLIVKTGKYRTYSLDANYSYRFNGQKYHSSRVSFSEGEDNFAAYWVNLEHRLLAEKESNESVALVNPNNPEEAVLDRTLRPGQIMSGLLFPAIFFFVGVAAIWAGSTGKDIFAEGLQTR